MPSPRDPRIDPQPGDVVRKHSHEYTVINVRDSGWIRANLKIGSQHLNSSISLLLIEWKERMSDGEVIKRG